MSKKGILPLMLALNDSWHLRLANPKLPGGNITCICGLDPVTRSFRPDLVLLLGLYNSTRDVPQVLSHLVVI